LSLRESRIIDGEIKVYDKVKVAIDRLKAFEPPEGYWLAFSGGKDSIVIKELANMSGVKYDAHYSLTTVDPPELVRFIFDQHKDVIVEKPKKTMWQLIVDHCTPPTRLVRYCCSELKEANGRGRVTMTGVRWSESSYRKNNRNLVDIGMGRKDKNGIVYNDENDESRRMVEQCYRTQLTLVNPIIDWTDDDVWQFIRENKISYCKLYDEGFDRLGCIGCPLSKNAETELNRWSTYRQAYLTAFEKMIARRKEKGLTTMASWKTPQDVMDWWLQKNKQEKQFEGQIEMEE
jgi:phosphoadenosine phosphosulfate reductase